MQPGTTEETATDDSPMTPTTPTPPRAPRAVVMTMARDESDMLPRWIDYYSRQLGMGSLIVLDDNSVDGSTDNLPCTLYRLPPEPWKRRWAKTRARLVNGMASGLLACNDVVIFTDVDEFLVADPGKYDGLLDYLAHRTDRPVIAPLAMEVVHDPRLEPAFDPARPLLEQRRFVKFSPGMCKPLVKRTPHAWEHAFHAINAPFEVDPDLWMLHLKYYDENALSQVAEHRLRIREGEGRGSPHSFWSKTPETLRSMVSSWTEGTSASDSVPELDAGELKLKGLITQRDDGNWRSSISQVAGLASSPLRQLPERFRDAF